MAYYDVQSSYEPGQLVTQSQGMPFGLPGSPGGPGMGLDLSGFGSGLGQLAQQSLDLRRQQALQQMALQQRSAALQEAQFSQQAGLQNDQFAYQQQRDALGDRQAKQARMDAENARTKAAIFAERDRLNKPVADAAYGQFVGGPNVVPGLISASGNTPGAVYTGFKQVAQGPTTFQGSMGQSKASLGPGLPWSPGFEPYLGAEPDPSQTAGAKTADARRQLMALSQPQAPGQPQIPNQRRG